MNSEISIEDGEKRFPENCRVYEIRRFLEIRAFRFMCVFVVYMSFPDDFFYNDEEVWDWKT